MMKMLALTLVSSGALASTLLAHVEPVLIWNASASVPIGLYAVQPISALSVADLVVARPPETLADWLNQRGYLPLGAPLIKRVGALSRQKICRDGLDVSIDGIVMAQARERDHLGRPLPAWRGCFLLHPDQIFLLNSDEPASLDGRYFGALPLKTILGRAVPICTREGH
jgi:conjugative transfer signal peptidase TraF